MANHGNTNWQRKAKHTWSLLKDNKRELQCHPATKVRVKVIEPGVQSRWCDRCGVWRYFILEPQRKMGDLLRLRWLTDEEAAHHEALADEATIRGSEPTISAPGGNPG